MADLGRGSHARLGGYRECPFDPGESGGRDLGSGQVFVYHWADQAVEVGVRPVSDRRMHSRLVLQHARSFRGIPELDSCGLGGIATALLFSCGKQRARCFSVKGSGSSGFTSRPL